jgi:hypothetical protein
MHKEYKMTNNHDDMFDAQGGLNFYDLICISLQRKMLILISISVCLVLSFVLLSFNKAEYSARLLIRPLAAEDNPSAPQGLSLSGGLLGQTTDENIALYVGTMRSVEMIQRAIKQRGLAQLLQSARWDAENKQWLPETGFSAAVRGTLNDMLGRSIERHPEDPAIVGSLLSNMLYISRADSKMTPNIYEVMIKAKNPDVALDTLTIIHEETVALIRENKVRNVEILLQGLRKRYAESSEVAYRSAFLEQIMQQEKRLLMLRDPQYPIVDVIDPPSFATAPHVITLKAGLGGGILAGLILGLLINLALYFLKGARKASAIKKAPSDGGDFPGDRMPTL